MSMLQTMLRAKRLWPARRSLSHQTHIPYRYVIKDKSAKRNLNIYAMPNGSWGKLAENQYVLKRAHLEKKKCFKRIEMIQKKCELIRKNNIRPCTSYDPKTPTLWMTVKNMYDSTALFVHPRPYIERLFA